MKSALILIAAIPAFVTSASAQQPTATELAAWQRQAQNVTIIRDDWGIAHIHGKTDADAVFGMMYAQAEDDFNRVETNYINSMGRLAEAEGEAEIYRDLRMKLFIDPDRLKAQYAKSPDWLKTLMNAWADGLNYYLHTHPDGERRASSRTSSRGWRSRFSEGSIGGDIEKVQSRPARGVLRQSHAAAARRGDADDATPCRRSRRGSNGIAIAPSNTATATRCC